MKYKLEDISIGDEVYFESVKGQSNHNLYWKVIEKIEGPKQLLVQLDTMGYRDLRWVISINEVTYLIKVNQS